MNSVVGLIFNEKVVESGICGSVNSTQVHCSPWKSQQMRAFKKKKEKKERKKPKMKTQTHRR